MDMIKIRIYFIIKKFRNNLNILVRTALRYFLRFRFGQSKGPRICAEMFKNFRSNSKAYFTKKGQNKRRILSCIASNIKSEQVNLKTDNECRNSTKNFSILQKLWQYETFFEGWTSPLCFRINAHARNSRLSLTRLLTMKYLASTEQFTLVQAMNPRR